METRYSMKNKFLLTLLLSAFPLLIYSQATTTCAENLKSAQALFDRGQIEQVPGMLRECMKSGFKREEQIAAYKLLIQSFLFEDRLTQADSTMLAFLKKYPEYQLSPTDHSSFVNLFNSFKVRSVIQLVFHFGSSMPFLTMINNVTLASEPAINKYSSNALNLSTSLEAKLALSPSFELNIEGGFSRLTFTNLEKNFLNFRDNKYVETQNRLEIPVSATYNFAGFGKFTFYGRAGLGAALNLATTAKAATSPTDQNNFEFITGADISRNDSRIFMDLFTQAGAGVKFKIPKGFVSMELRSNFGFFNQVIRGKASSENLARQYSYADDDFNLNYLNLTISVSQIFYKASKRK
jgi:hypothetical protein